MERLSEPQLILAMLEMTNKEGTLLAVQTADLLQAIQQNKFQQALKQYERSWSALASSAECCTGSPRRPAA
jgi:muramidase (phage lysozyme)